MDKDFQKSYDTLEWSKKRTKILERDNFTCQVCGRQAGNGHFNVHHLTYEHCKNKHAWDCPDEDLVTLCDECHQLIHLPYPFSDASKNFKHLKKLFTIINEDNANYRLSLTSIDDGMMGCLKVEDKETCLLIHQGEFLPFINDAGKALSLMGEPDIIFKRGSKVAADIIEAIECIIKGGDAFYPFFVSIISDFTHEIPWNKETSEKETYFTSVLLTDALFDDRRIYELITDPNYDNIREKCSKDI